MKFLIIGGGSIGQRHLNNLYSLEYKNLFCFKRAYSSAFESKYNCKVITSVAEVEQIKPDAIFICNPTSLHGDWVEIAARIGANVFVEKPLTHSQVELDRIKSVWKHDKVFFIGFMLRYHPLVKKIKELLAEEKIGKVYSARFEFGSWLPYWHPWEDYKISYASRKELGGGVVNTITHELDLAQHFFGTPDAVKSVKANFNILNIEVEELAESILIYPDKLVTLHVDYLQKDYDRNIKVLGTDGKIVWDWHTNVVKVSLHKSLEESYRLENFDANLLYIDELQDFISCIEDQKQLHDLDFNHAITNSQLMLNMHHSADKKV